MDLRLIFYFFFNDTATTEIYTLSLHDALPITIPPTGTMYRGVGSKTPRATTRPRVPAAASERDRKSTRLNSSHANISYAVFCLKKKKHKSTKSTMPRVILPADRS